MYALKMHMNLLKTIKFKTLHSMALPVRYCNRIIAKDALLLGALCAGYLNMK